MAELQNYKCKKPAYCNSHSSEIAVRGATLFLRSVAKSSTALVCIVVNGENIQSRAVTLTLVWQCPISNLSEIFLHTTIYSFQFHVARSITF